MAYTGTISSGVMGKYIHTTSLTKVFLLMQSFAYKNEALIPSFARGTKLNCLQAFGEVFL